MVAWTLPLALPTEMVPVTGDVAEGGRAAGLCDTAAVDGGVCGERSERDGGGTGMCLNNKSAHSAGPAGLVKQSGGA